MSARWKIAIATAAIGVLAVASGIHLTVGDADEDSAAAEEPVQEPIGRPAEKPSPDESMDPIEVPTDDDTVDDSKPIGYASLNGGTAGGFGASSANEVVLSGYWADSGASSPGDALADLLSEHRDTSGEGLVIYVDESISAVETEAEEIDVKDVEHVSILGVGDAGVLDGVGINVSGSHDIVIRNLVIHNVSQGQGDGIGIQDASSNVWIDHNELYNEYPDVDKDHYDGLIDVKGGSQYITVSWNHLHDSWKTMLTASSDDEGANGDYITYANNRFENLNSRVPLIRRSQVHMLNNYFNNV